MQRIHYWDVDVLAQAKKEEHRIEVSIWPFVICRVRLYLEFGDSETESIAASELPCSIPCTRTMQNREGDLSHHAESLQRCDLVPFEVVFYTIHTPSIGEAYTSFYIPSTDVDLTAATPVHH